MGMTTNDNDRCFYEVRHDPPIDKHSWPCDGLRSEHGNVDDEGEPWFDHPFTAAPQTAGDVPAIDYKVCDEPLTNIEGNAAIVKARCALPDGHKTHVGGGMRFIDTRDFFDGIEVGKKKQQPPAPQAAGDGAGSIGFEHLRTIHNTHCTTENCENHCDLYNDVMHGFRAVLGIDVRDCDQQPPATTELAALVRKLIANIRKVDRALLADTIGLFEYAEFAALVDTIEAALNDVPKPGDDAYIKGWKVGHKIGVFTGQKQPPTTELAALVKDLTDTLEEVPDTGNRAFDAVYDAVAELDRYVTLADAPKCEHEWVGDDPRNGKQCRKCYEVMPADAPTTEPERCKCHHFKSEHRVVFEKLSCGYKYDGGGQCSCDEFQPTTGGEAK